ncbi:2-keto-4-pentenoate hydratase/2-oxohepta-3-ene-1,7-dioic acid hydratase (catechol pathway) [Rhodoferax sp. OV413]|uniref:fumarylacetoacetate hydrolase family protein n=1 Tax=Rhodoferax sp. OV413 TaxID=1855285 RepID=UPI0008905C82|nr:fumarylacetoacetate hydrolase family protein [Rhodoferax sp. OV413]SDP60654.1 2-keto-4-pentenoate hydratase/2-oxohepta-3-ene-1,7-dioic acid hydratase (catechol pathway) [Rhodoferax sp. OV413]
MKLVSFEHEGSATYGVAQQSEYLQPSADFLSRYPDVVSVLRGNALAELEAGLSAATRIQAASTRALPVIPNPNKLICVGLNYKTHVAETKRADSDYPSLFLRFNDSLAAQGDVVLRPAFSDRFDWEGELAFVIGKGGRHIPKEQAFEHIAGYACFNDISVRDWQRHTHQFTPGKNFPGTAPFGPCLVTRDEVPDVTKLTLETRVNGQVMQHASLADLIFDIPVLVEYISRFTPLSPGDVIATGTPGGVGDRREPPLYMKEGDVVEVEITGLGVLRNRIGTAT